MQQLQKISTVTMFNDPLKALVKITRVKIQPKAIFLLVFSNSFNPSTINASFL